MEEKLETLMADLFDLKPDRLSRFGRLIHCENLVNPMRHNGDLFGFEYKAVAVRIIPGLCPEAGLTFNIVC